MPAGEYLPTLFCLPFKDDVSTILRVGVISLQSRHIVTSQKIRIFCSTAVRLSNLLTLH
jgi:hypothetical protein